MEVAVDKAGHDEAVAAFDDGTARLVAEAGADGGDAIAVDEDVAGEGLGALRAAHGEDLSVADEGAGHAATDPTHRASRGPPSPSRGGMARAAPSPIDFTRIENALVD